MNWLARLKKIATLSELEATKTTETLFVVSVAPVLAFMQKTGVDRQAANDAANPTPDPLNKSAFAHKQDTAYQAHHFHCQTCMAAGRGIRYGVRCGVGISLWRAYRAARA